MKKQFFIIINVVAMSLLFVLANTAFSAKDDDHLYSDTTEYKEKIMSSPESHDDSSIADYPDIISRRKIAKNDTGFIKKDSDTKEERDEYAFALNVNENGGLSKTIIPALRELPILE